MRVHHLNCATMCPLGGRMVSGGQAEAKLICHCLLIESEQGLVLVDTGFGIEDCTNPKKVDGGLKTFGRPKLDVAETAIRQIEALGFTVDDVRHIVPTHLDPDHAGGLPDFPRAEVHVFRPEQEAAMNPRTLMEKKRYVPANFAHDVQWRLYDAGGEPWFGFEAVRDLAGLPPEILLIPLTGHTRGHVAVAVDVGDRWLLHAGDAYFFRDEMNEPPRCPGGLALFQRIAAVDNRQRLANQARLRALKKAEGSKVHVFSAHDVVELEALR